MSRLLFLPLELLGFAQVRVESIEPLLPEPAVTLHPFGDIPEALRLEPGRTPLRLAAARDEPGALEHLEMLRDRGKRHVEGLGQLRDGRLTLRETREDGPPCRVGERTEGEAQRVGLLHPLVLVYLAVT